MMEWIKDPIHGWVLVPEWMATMCRAERGFGNDLAADREADRLAYSRIHSSMPASAKVTPAGAAPAFTVDDLMKPAPKPSGWSEALPLKTPHVDLVDRVAEGFAREDRVEREAAFRRKLK
jgi:hypothetical protein